MKRLSFIAFASLPVLSLSLCACGGPSATEVARHVSGAVTSPSGHQIDTVEAVSHYADFNSGQADTVYAAVDGDGRFDVLVYGGGAVRIAFMEQDKSIGVLQFPRNNGSLTTLLHITSAPYPTFNPQNGPGSSSEQEVKIVYEDKPIDLGAISSPKSDNIYQAANNPLGQVDEDSDGFADLVDDDADGDGVLDKNDKDLDNDGADDATENNDLDNNGFPDEEQI